MIILLSPAKNMDFDPVDLPVETTRPALSADIGELAEVTKGLTRSDLSRLMGISDNLADLNYERFQAFKPRASKGTKPAALAFNGDVYQGLDAPTMGVDDLAFAQEHLRILSGLYGVLRPLDAIQPYRLEMGTRLKTDRGGNLYDFWGDKIAKAIAKDLKKMADPFILNLASNEYFGAVDLDVLDVPVISPAFKEEKDGKSRMLMFYAKRARGAMARWAIDQRITSPEALKDFDIDGYRFQPDQSKDLKWVFTRPQPEPKSASKAA